MYSQKGEETLDSSNIDPALTGELQSTKRRRVTKACDRCNKSGVKCASGPNPAACIPCHHVGATCTFDRPSKRRGPSAKGRDSHSHEASSSQPPLDRSRGSRLDFGAVRIEPAGPDDDWQYSDFAPTDVIEGLLEAFKRICHNTYPFFHWPTFWTQVQLGLYKTDRAFSAAVMAACAMSSARIRDGAIDRFPNPPIFPVQAAISLSEFFYQAAVKAIPGDLSVATHFNYKRAKALLCATAIQLGYARTFNAHLGDYITMCSIDGFHCEVRWPAGLTQVEIQERRRLFWQMYQMDVYSAVTWNGIIRHRESQSTVLYPAEVDDEDITEHEILEVKRARPPWMKGWIFVVDLYRILEHAAERLRARKTVSPDDPSSPVSMLFERERGPSTAEVMGVVTKLYEKLPQEFKGGKAMTGNVEEDRFGFQAANIIVTLQTVKMVMAGTEEANVSQRCMIAGELLDGLASVPTAYIHAASTPMMHHLAGVGHLLGSVIQSPLSQWTYLQVRNVLLAMVDLLASLEANTSTEGGSTRLKAHIQRIDAYMTNAAREKQGKEVYHSALPKEAWSNEHEASLRSTYDIYTAGTMSSHPSTSNQHDLSTALEGESSNAPARPTEPVNLASLAEASNYPYTLSSDDPFGQPEAQPDTQDWFSQQNISPDQQVQLPESFFTDWPFSMGQGEAFNFLGDMHGQTQGTGPAAGGATNSSGQGQAQGSGSGSGNGNGASGIQDILGVGMPDGFVGNGQIGGVLGSLGFSGGQ